MKRKHDANDMNSQQALQLQARVNNGRGGNIASNASSNGSSNLNSTGNTQNSSDANNFENHCSLNNSGTINNNNNNIASGRNDNNSNNQRPQQKRICREFVKGSCRRLQCRYPHVMSADQIIFCHDFQNTSCIRTNCKFLHYTLEEEDYYVMRGEFPTEKAKEFSRPMPPKMPQPYEGNYDRCTIGYDRPSSLLCRHRNCSNDRQPIQMPSPNLSGRTQVPPNLRSQSNSPPTPWNDFPNRQNYRNNDQSHLIPNSEYRNGYCNDYQFGNGYMSQQSVGGGQTNNFQRSQLQEDKNRIPQSHQDSHECSLRQRSLEEVVNMLRCRIEVAELTVAEVRATNEYLLTQMRLNKMQQQCSQCSSTVVVNPVTVTQTTSQPQTAQVIGAVSMAPVQVQASPIVSIATPQTQIITNNAAAPLAIATNTSQGQQLAIAQQNITSLSNTTQPLGGTHAQQILGTSQITLAPAIGNGPSMGLTINTSQALAMSNATQPIISYPVMTHSILPH